MHSGGSVILTFIENDFKNCDEVWNVAYFDLFNCSLINQFNVLIQEDWMLDKNKGNVIKRRGMNIDPLT